MNDNYLNNNHLKDISLNHHKTVYSTKNIKHSKICSLCIFKFPKIGFSKQLLLKKKEVGILC